MIICSASRRRLLLAGTIGALAVVVWPAAAQQTPAAPEAPPPWAQGRPETAIGAKLAPIAPPPLPTTADKLPIAKLKAAGHGRYLAAKLLDLAKIPVIVVAGLSLTKQRALAIADNKIAENAGWDRERLAIEIPELTELLSADPIINGPLSQPALRGM
jgi:hypothetical protein